MTRKIFFTAILIFLSASISFGAVSDDNEIYLRRDVFEAKMDAFMAEIRLMNEQLYNKLHGEIEEVRKELIETKIELSERIDNLNGRIDILNGRFYALGGRINGLKYKIDVLKTIIYFGLGLLTLAITLAGVVPVLAKLFKDMRTPSITFDDVKRFIEENYPNMTLNGQTQISNVNPLR